MPVTLTWVSGWRCPWRLWYPVLFLNLWIRSLGPLVCATTSPVTATFASAAASVSTSAPSTTSTADSDTASPGAPTSFSTSITSPSATLYCLPPVLTIAYIGRGLLLSCWRMGHGRGAGDSAQQPGTRSAPGVKRTSSEARPPNRGWTLGARLRPRGPGAPPATSSLVASLVVSRPRGGGSSGSRDVTGPAATSAA